MAIRINKKRIAAHVLFWVLYLSYLVISDGWRERDYILLKYSPQIWTTIMLAATMVYANLYFLVPCYFYPKKYARYGAGLILLLLAGGLATRYIAYSIWIPWERVNDPANYDTEALNFFIPLRIIRDSVEFYPVVAVTMLLKIGNNWYQHEKRLRQLEQEKFNAELHFLKAQLHPHFFFNTLNSLYALTLKRSEKSPEVVLRLSGLMHYVLYDTNSDFVSLDNDIKHLKDYTSLEEMRFADRLELSFQHSGDIAGKIIAPLILLPFVENAFKHSLRDETEKAWIIIDIKVSGDTLFFKAENSCRQNDTPGRIETPNREEAPAQAKGVGLANAKRRLELTYPGRYELNIDHNDLSYQVGLKIQLSDRG